MAKIGPEEFEGTSGEMRDSPWLASEDIEGKGDVPVTIEKVFRHRNVEFEGGRKKAIVYALQFERCQRQLVLNGTNRKQINSMFGNKVTDWIGKTIKLYVDPNVRLGSEVTKGIRIRKD